MKIKTLSIVGQCIKFDPQLVDSEEWKPGTRGTDGRSGTPSYQGWSVHGFWYPLEVLEPTPMGAEGRLSIPLTFARIMSMRVYNVHRPEER